MSAHVMLQPQYTRQHIRQIFCAAVLTYTIGLTLDPNLMLTLTLTRAGLDARFRFPAVQTNGALDDFELWSVRDARYTMENEPFAGDRARCPIFKCVGT